MSEHGFSVPLRVDQIPADGKRVRLEADPDARRRIAEALSIAEVVALRADLKVDPVGNRVFAVRGTVVATIVQTDVVTLDPVRQEIAEDVDLTLVPAENGVAARHHAMATGKREESGEPPDLYHNGRIDLGAVASEQLALGLDPYPRAPGVAFGGHIEDDDAPVSPFAALERLKDTEK